MTVVRVTVAIAVLVALVAGCQPSGRPFQVTLVTDFADPLPVTLTDETGLVTAIEQVEADAASVGDLAALQADPTDPNASVLTWVGGACDQDTTVWFHVLSGGYVMNVAIHERLGMGCTAVGIPRGIRITTTRPIPADSVTVAGGS
jgi:hypothetical protein